MIAEIENAMLQRLQSAKALGLFGYVVKTIDSLGVEFDDAEALKKSVNLVPGMWVTFQDEVKSGDGAYGEHRMKATFRVVVAAMNKRNQAATRHGAVKDVGTYQMAQDVRAVLAGQKLGLDIGYLEPVRIRTFPAVERIMPGLSVLAVEFTTTYTATDAPDQPGAQIGDPNGPDVPRDKGLAEAMAIGAGITDFRTSHADWVPPLNQSDTVNLEQ